MEIYKLLRKGAMHKDFCEDFLLSNETKDAFKFFAVFDGCSTGIDSHFASTLWAKSIKSVVEKNASCNYENLQNCLDNVLFNSIMTIKEIRQILKLSIDELLSTIIILAIDNSNSKGEIMVFGDGLVSINGQDYNIDQNNQPDYMAYHLNKIESFDDYLNIASKHGKRFSFEDVSDIVISTDGIYSFEKTSIFEHQETIPDVKSYLFRDEFLLHNPSMLSRKCNLLRSQFGLINQDDIAIIKVINKR